MADHLCVNCSLCCSGKLYARVPVSPEERDRLGGGDRFFRKSNGDLRMRLGCDFLGKNGACQVYDKRPETCRTYKCSLLKRVDAGKTPESEAIAIVAEIHETEDKARASIAQALGKEPYALNTSDLHDAMDRLIETGDEDAPSYRHAKLWYRHYLSLVRLHIRPGFRA